MAMLDDITIRGEQWISINAAASVPVGTKMRIQNKSARWGILYEGAQPSPGSSSGVKIGSIGTGEASKLIESGSEEIWCIVDNSSIASIVLSIQTE